MTGIRGNVRHRVVQCIGEAGHSGAVPRWLRRDAVFATAELITHLDRHWRTLLERGRDLGDYIGHHGNRQPEHAIARIPGTVKFSFEARSQSQETLEAFYDLFVSECASIGEERGVEFLLDRRLQSAPATMDPVWVDKLRDAARKRGLPDEPIPSGAGHDAAVFANAGIPSAMIFVRNENGSHNPHEDMRSDDFMAGVAVMRAGVERPPMNLTVLFNAAAKPKARRTASPSGGPMTGTFICATARCCEAVLPFTAGAVCARHRDAQSGAAGHDGRGRRSPIARAFSPHARPASDFQPLMTCYLTDDTSADEIEKGLKERVWIAAKLYPAGATTNSHHGVTDIKALAPVLERMERIGMPVLIHGEATDPAIDIFDREAVFMQDTLLPLLQAASGPEGRDRARHDGRDGRYRPRPCARASPERSRRIIW